MKLIKITGLAIIFSVPLLNSCEKESRWHTSIYNKLDISYESVVLEADYYLPGNNSGLSVGICFGLDENVFIVNDPCVTDYIEKGQILKFNIPNLNSEERYCFKSYITTSGHSTIYSAPYWLETKPLPDPTCSFNQGEIAYNGTSETTSNLSQVADYYHWVYKSTALGSTIYFEFKEKPVSRIYKTAKYDSFYSNEEVDVHGVIGSGYYSCFYRAPVGQDIYVYPKDDGLEIKFCDVSLSFYSGSSCEFGDYQVSGYLKE